MKMSMDPVNMMHKNAKNINGNPRDWRPILVLHVRVRTKQIFYRNTESRNKGILKTEIWPKQNIRPKQSSFCRNMLVSSEPELYRPNENYFCQKKLNSALKVSFL